jgi:hypothetical protein
MGLSSNSLRVIGYTILLSLALMRDSAQKRKCECQKELYYTCVLLQDILSKEIARRLQHLPSSTPVAIILRSYSVSIGLSSNIRTHHTGSSFLE